MPPKRPAAGAGSGSKKTRTAASGAKGTKATSRAAKASSKSGSKGGAAKGGASKGGAKGGGAKAGAKKTKSAKGKPAPNKKRKREPPRPFTWDLVPPVSVEVAAFGLDWDDEEEQFAKLVRKPPPYKPLVENKYKVIARALPAFWHSSSTYVHCHHPVVTAPSTKSCEH